MASSTEGIVLKGPEEWETWNLAFRTEAAANDFLKVVDGTEKMLAAPVKPAYKDYEKRLVDPTLAGAAAGTRSQSTASTDTIPTTQERVDPVNKPESVGHMTPKSQKSYQDAWNQFQHEFKVISEQKAGNRALVNWVRKTVIAAFVFDVLFPR